MNLCRSCGQDFSSVRLFDAHRIGKHDYLAAGREGGRRCLSREEMLGCGWARDARGRWQDPAHSAIVRETFAKAA